MDSEQPGKEGPLAWAIPSMEKKWVDTEHHILSLCYSQVFTFLIRDADVKKEKCSLQFPGVAPLSELQHQLQSLNLSSQPAAALPHFLWLLPVQLRVFAF